MFSSSLLQKAVASIERDENYVPSFRSDYKLPPKERASTADYLEVFEETPIFTLCRMLFMQAWSVSYIILFDNSINEGLISVL